MKICPLPPAYTTWRELHCSPGGHPYLRTAHGDHAVPGSIGQEDREAVEAWLNDFNNSVLKLKNDPRWLAAQEYVQLPLRERVGKTG